MSKKDELLEELSKRWENFLKANSKVQALFSASPNLEEINLLDSDELVRLEEKRKEAYGELKKIKEQLRSLEKGLENEVDADISEMG